MNFQRLQPGEQSLGIFRGSRCKVELGLWRVRDSKSAAGIDVANIVSSSPKLFDQISDALHCCHEWINRQNLRANVNTHASGLEPLAVSSLGVKLRRSRNWDAKFVLAQSCRNVRMGFS